MTSSIRSLCAAGLVLGAFAMASPGTAGAQGKGHKAEKAVQKNEQKAEKAVAKADRRMDRQVDRRMDRQTDRRVARAVVRRSTSRARNRYLCNDGTWWSSNTCVGHDGLASRQPTPRASAQGIAHANANSAVARAYADGVRANAIARCNDGTFWHGNTRTSACYRHGGVALWY